MTSYSSHQNEVAWSPNSREADVHARGISRIKKRLHLEGVKFREDPTYTNTAVKILLTSITGADAEQKVQDVFREEGWEYKSEKCYIVKKHPSLWAYWSLSAAWFTYALFSIYAWKSWWPEVEPYVHLLSFVYAK